MRGIYCLYGFPSQSFLLFLQLKIGLFCYSFVFFFHSTAPNFHWEFRCTSPTPKDRCTSTFQYVSPVATFHTVFKVQGNTNVFQLAWFEEAWPKLFEIFSIHSRLPVCHMLSYHRSADDGSFSTINLQITYSFLLKIISLSKIILLFHHYLL